MKIVHHFAAIDSLFSGRLSVGPIMRCSTMISHSSHWHPMTVKGDLSRFHLLETGNSFLSKRLSSACVLSTHGMERNSAVRLRGNGYKVMHTSRHKFVYRFLSKISHGIDMYTCSMLCLHILQKK